MINNDYFLTYRYTNASVEILVMSGETELYKLDVCKAIKLSTGKPWNNDPMSFDMVDVADENGVITLLIEGSSMMITASFSISEMGLLSAEMEWKNTSGETLNDVVLGVAFPVRMNDIEKIIIPSVCFNSGVNDSGDFKNRQLMNGGFVAEEHRLSVPAVAIERPKRTGSSVAIFSIPSRCELNPNPDNEWSIGIVRNKDMAEILICSGAVMYAGKKDTILSGRDAVRDYERGYFDMPADSSVRKKFCITDWDPSREITGMDKLVRVSDEIYKPKAEKATNYNVFLRNKGIALKNRFIMNEEMAGYIRKLSSESGDEEDTMHYNSVSDAWTTDNLAAAWCDALNSLQCMKRDGIMRARQCIDFYINSSKCKKKGVRYLYLDTSTMKWSFSSKGDLIPVADFGKMVYYLAENIQLFKDHCLEVPDGWEEALVEAADFIAAKKRLTKEGRYPEVWNSDGSVGISDESALSVNCIGALAKAYYVTGEEKYRKMLAPVLGKYYELIISKHRGFQSIKDKNNHSELYDSDKLAETYFVIAALECYEATQHEEKYIKWARAVLIRLITFVDIVDYPLRRDTRLAKINADLLGLSVSGSGEYCLDTIFPSHEMKMVGDFYGDQLLRRYAELTLNAVMKLASTGDGEYGILAVGEHPESFCHTNWSHNNTEDDFRGGCSGFNNLSSLVWSFRQALKASSTSFM